MYSVWHDGLFYKLRQYNIGGKFYDLIKKSLFSDKTFTGPYTKWDSFIPREYKTKVAPYTVLTARELVSKSCDVYSPRNDPGPDMIPNPEMIPKLTPSPSVLCF